VDRVSEDEDLPPLVDEEGLRGFLREEIPVGEEPPTFEVEHLDEGKSNETFRVTWGPKTYVLRRPPRGAFLPTAHDVLREYRVLSALQDAGGVRIPRPVAACGDGDVIGAEFYLMEDLEGEVLRQGLPDRWSDAEDQAAIGTELVDTLAELHNVEWEGTDLEDIGYEEGYLDRQVERWQDQWSRTRDRTEKVREVPELDEVGEWLAANKPETRQTTVVHGDYKLDNVVFDGEPPSLVGVLDWEMATLGDPLADLGYVLTFWREEGDPSEDLLGIEPRVTERPGFPTRDELVARYRRTTGLDTSNLHWYKVLAIWKLAILLEGSYARYLAGKETDPFFEMMQEGVPQLAERAKAVALGERDI
jgi:aminoglycoside phosphotransferase (APT) family kinase protein